MKRISGTIKVEELRSSFVEIEFPEYQREPDVWNRDQKQRLIDSILRQFDISTLYFYQREDGGLECIDGRQRINAIMSFLGNNPNDESDDGFTIRVHNEIYTEINDDLSKLDGFSFRQLEEAATGDASTDLDQAAAAVALESILSYEITRVLLSDASVPEEFNLQFLRLNLGTLINSGEKLHAMVGNMRDLLFDSPRVGQHDFFEHIRIPTRRYAKEQVAGQVLIQVFEYETSHQFTRARHFDLQRFLKAHADTDTDTSTIAEIERTLDALEEHLGDVAESLRNRAIAVSVVLLAWQRRLFEDPAAMANYRAFLAVFLERLEYQVGRMREFDSDPRYPYLIDFQRHVTQASVEKPAVTRRHMILAEQLDHWLANGALQGD